MKANLGKIDRAVRLVLAVVIGIFAYRLSIEGAITEGVALILVVASVALFVNALTARCFAYKLVGINSCEIKHRAHHSHKVAHLKKEPAKKTVAKKVAPKPKEKPKAKLKAKPKAAPKAKAKPKAKSSKKK
jgi:hypothetical protein